MAASLENEEEEEEEKEGEEKEDCLACSSQHCLAALQQDVHLLQPAPPSVAQTSSTTTGSSTSACTVSPEGWGEEGRATSWWPLGGMVTKAGEESWKR